MTEVMQLNLQAELVALMVRNTGRGRLGGKE